MKHRVIVLALASATFSLNAHAADDFCSRAFVQALSQICQLLPSGLNLCQPVALIGTDPACATPAKPALVRVGPPTLQPPSSWIAPRTEAAWSLPTLAPPVPTLPRIMAPVPKEAPAVPGSTASTLPPPPPISDTPAAAIAPAQHAAIPYPVPASPIQVAPTPAIVPAAPTSVAAEVKEATRPMAIPPMPVPAASLPTTPITDTAANAPVANLSHAQAPIRVVPTPAIAPALPAITPAAITSMPGNAVFVVSVKTTAMMDALAHFDFDSAKLTAAGRAVLDDWLRKAPRNKSVRVSGHTDRLGPQPYNLELSLRRAEAVKQYLVSKGINPRRIRIEARGEADPVKHCMGGATPATKACLAPNRRAVIDPK